MYLKIGQYNRLRVLKQLDFGLILDGFDHGDILLPNRYVPKGIELDDEVDVFIYNDSEDRLIATTEKPFATVGDFALLRVKAKNEFGFFLDWGLPKDLMVPFREQRKDMEIGRSYIVYLYVDEQTDRIVASAKIVKFLTEEKPDYVKNQEVDLIIIKKTDLGMKALINKKHTGMIFDNEIFQELKVGQRIKGFVKRIREDGKIDLSLNRIGFDIIDNLADKILTKLEENDNFLPLNDKSTPQEILNTFNVSKKAFKKALGILYKERVISLENDGIRKV